MLDPQLLAIAASGMLDPDLVARLADMSLDDLRHQHGAEIRAVQDQVRGAALRTVLTARPSPEVWITALATEAEAWQVAIADPLTRRRVRAHAVLALDDDTWRAAGDAAGLRLCDHQRSRLPDDNRHLILRHLEAIFRDATARPGLRRQAGQALLSALC